MDAPGNAQASSQQQQQQLASMIRPEQVKRLPHLSDDKKQQHEAFIHRLWDTLRTSPQGSPENQKALANLATISQNLMAGMKRFNAQQRQHQQPGLPGQQSGPSSEAEASRTAAWALQENHILPHIQQKVNSYQFAMPPSMAEGSVAAEGWLREARKRLAQAMQRAEAATRKKEDITRQVAARNQSGNPLSQQETEALRQKLAQCNKVLAESSSFMDKFKEQQTTFRGQAQQQQQQRYDPQTQPNTASSENANPVEPSIPIGQPTTQQGGPQAHSISSAVSAARDRATNAAANNNQQDSTSPTNPQVQTTQASSGQQPPPPPPQQQHTPQSAMPQSHHNGGPLPFSTQSALASSYGQNQPQSATHAHPPQNASFINTPKKEERPNIPKNLNVTAPRPVPMPPARPTLNGGPGVGMPGQMGEPAIPSMPGYVLETSEDGRVLSKKKLNELAREVCGPEAQLTSEAEEVRPS